MSRLVVTMLLSGLAVMGTACPRPAAPSPAAAPPGLSSENAATERERFVVYQATLLPQRFETLSAKLSAAREGGDAARLVDLYRELVAGLEREWGADDLRLAAYHYDYCVAIKLTGATSHLIEEVDLGVARWPRSAAHRLLSAVSRMTASSQSGRLLDGTREAVEALFAGLRETELRALRVDPADLHLQWASVLLAAAREPELALVEIRGARDLGRSGRGIALLEAQCLLALGRPEEASAATRRELEPQSASPEEAITLAAIYLDLDRAAEAWGVLRPAIESLRPRGDRERAPPPRLARTLSIRSWEEASIEDRLRLRAAEALERLGKPHEAVAALLPVVESRPLDTTALHRLARGVRALGRFDAAKALEKRSRDLATSDYHAERFAAERARGELAAAAYHRGRALEHAGKLGEAIAAYGEGLHRAPRSVQLELARVDCLVLSGRLDLAIAANARAREALRSGVLAANQARLLAIAGRPELARPALAAAERERPADPRDAALFSALVCRARLALDPQSDGALGPELARIEEAGPRAPPDALVVAALTRATLALERGDREAARALASRQAIEALDQVRWARAVELLATETSTPDLTPLIDTNWLVPRILARPELGVTPESPASRAAEVIRESSRILDEIAGAREDGTGPLSRELIALFEAHGASQKARESAWFWLFTSPNDPEAWNTVASLLRRPGDEAELLALAHSAESAGLATPELLELRDRALERLGIPP